MYNTNNTVVTNFIHTRVESWKDNNSIELDNIKTNAQFLKSAATVDLPASICKFKLYTIS